MVFIKSVQEVCRIRTSNLLAGSVLLELSKIVKPGITTLQLDKIAEGIILGCGATPGFKNYRGFKYSLCTSVNSQIIHGVPSNYVLKDGDIISLDVGVLKDGYYGDTAITIPVGKASNLACKLIRDTHKALLLGIEEIRPEKRTSDISSAIQKYADNNGYSLIRDFGGHGVGASLHEDPFIPNYFSENYSTVLKEGMVIAIEPMLSVGKATIREELDGWTISTADNELSAHFEHTVLVTSQGYEILSKRKGELNGIQC